MDLTVTRLRCEECAQLSVGAARGWRTYLAPDPDEPEAGSMLATYCPACAEREFGVRTAGASATDA
jgi:Zn finger protein HypA/HybF involved in hydrogenase expression